MSLSKLLDRRRSRLGRDKIRHKPGDSFQGDHIHGFFSDIHDLRDQAKDEMLTTKQPQYVKDIKAKLAKRGADLFADEDVVYAYRLPFADGSVEKAAHLLRLVLESESMLVKEYDPQVKLRGAVNRAGISCYLDSVLFAMFAQLTSFEVMLHNQLEDRNRNHLAALLRLWVNVERSGHLVTTDITREIQEALARCGWKDAAERHQQDALEAFTFILEQLGFPDLHLKMDIFHSGKEDKEDDHKIVRERVLVMPLPEPREDGLPIKLEDCFELALIARIDVRRKYERERRATISSLRSPQNIDFSKGGAIHVETVEVGPSDVDSPTVETLPNGLGSPQRPSSGGRSSSFIKEREVSDDEKAIEAGIDELNPQEKRRGRGRAPSARKEVLMPAWQMYSLIPFHTDEEPKSDAEVVEHLRAKQPTFCIALKRYSFGTNGRALRRDDYVDIPLDMALPHFIYDNSTTDNNYLFEKFKITLQSLVCHRGTQVDSGHYIAIARVPTADGGSKWLLSDDLAEHRVREIDIQQALKDEMPYLLFYRVEPIRELLPPPPDQPPPPYQLHARTSSTSATARSIASDNDSSVGDPALASASSASRGRTSTSRERPPSLTLTDASFLSGDSALSVASVAAKLAPAAITIPSMAYALGNSNGSNANNQSAPVSRHASRLRRPVSEVRARSQGPGAPSEGLAADDATPRTSTSASRARNRLSGLFSSATPVAAMPPPPPPLPSSSTTTTQPLPQPAPPPGTTTATASPQPRRERDREKDKSRRRVSAHAPRARARHGDVRPERECCVM